MNAHRPVPPFVAPLLTGLLLAVLLLGGCVAQAAPAQVIAVIARTGGVASRVTPQDVVRLYSGARPVGAEARDVRLADYGDARDLRNIFYLATAGRDARQTHAFWTQAVFAGSVRVPMYVSSTAQMLNAVDRDERVVGYVWEAEVAGDVQVIHRITPK